MFAGGYNDLLGGGAAAGLPRTAPGYSRPRFNKTDTLYQRQVTVDTVYDTDFDSFTDSVACYVNFTEAANRENAEYWKGMKGFPALRVAETGGSTFNNSVVDMSVMTGGEQILHQSPVFAVVNGRNKHHVFDFVGIYPFDAPEVTEDPHPVQISGDVQTWNTTGRFLHQGEYIMIDVPDDDEFKSGSYMPDIPQRYAGARTALFRATRDVKEQWAKAIADGSSDPNAAQKVKHTMIQRRLETADYFHWKKLEIEMEDDGSSREERLFVRGKTRAIETDIGTCITLWSNMEVMEGNAELHNIRVHKI